MKVLYLTGMYPTPAYPQKGIFCHEQVKALKQIGVDVDVVVPITIYDREVRQRKWTYEGVEIRYVRFFKLPGTQDFHRTGKNLFFALDHSIDLKKYDIYHADAPLPAGQAAMIASEKYEKPFVVHGHGLDVFLEESYKDSKNIFKIVDISVKVYKKANAVCGVSKKVIERIEEKVKLDDRGYVVYNGVDIDKFYPDESKRGNYILSVGNLIPLKGHDDTIKAFSLYKQDRNDTLRLKIVGRGELEEQMKRVAKECGVEDSVDFLGYVPYGQVRDLMQGAKLFCLPSWHEALGCVYLEAMACGIPAIGCRENGIDEIIEDKTDGFLVDAHSPSQISEILNEVITHPNEAIGQKASNKIRTVYTWEKSAGRLKNVYEGIK